MSIVPSISSVKNSLQEIERYYSTLKTKSRQNGGDPVKIKVGEYTFYISMDPKDKQEKTDDISGKSVMLARKLNNHSPGDGNEISNLYQGKIFFKDRKELMKLLQKPDLLEQTLKLIDSINPVKPKPTDGKTMEQLSKIARDPLTPPALKNTILHTVYTAYKTASSYAAKGFYGIPESIVQQLAGEGGYAIVTGGGSGTSISSKEEIVSRVGTNCASQIQQKDDFVYYDSPYVKDRKTKDKDLLSNQLIIYNSNPKTTWSDKSLEALTEGISSTSIKEQLEQCTSKEDLQELTDRYNAIKSIAEERRFAVEQCAIALPVLDAFGAMSGDEDFQNKAGGGMQNISRAPMLFNVLKEKLDAYKVALDKAAERIKNTNITDIQKQATFSNATR